MSTDKKAQSQLQQLLNLQVSNHLEPEQRLCLAVLRQAVLDYFGEDPTLKQSAADYFARSTLYKLTLQMLRLPVDLLPIGIDLGRHPQDVEPVDPLKLETLVNELSGTQLKVMLSLGLLELPVSAGAISKQCRLNRATVLKALAEMAEQGLVKPLDSGLYTIWTVPAGARLFLDRLWAAAGWAAADRDAVGEEVTLSPLPDDAAAAPEPVRPEDSAAE